MVQELSENGISVMLLKPARKVLERNKSTGYTLHVLNTKNFSLTTLPYLKKSLHWDSSMTFNSAHPVWPVLVSAQ